MPPVYNGGISPGQKWWRTILEIEILCSQWENLIRGLSFFFGGGGEFLFSSCSQSVPIKFSECSLRCSQKHIPLASAKNGKEHKYTKAIFAATNEVRQHATRGPGFFCLVGRRWRCWISFWSQCVPTKFPLCSQYVPNNFSLFFISYPLP